MDLLQPFILTALICLGVGFALGYLAGSGRAAQGDHPVNGASLPQSQAPCRAVFPPGDLPSKSPGPPPTQHLGMASSPAQAVPRPSLNPVDALARVLQPDSQRQDAPKSIAAQIDEILQEKLAEAPPSETRSVRLLEVPQKGVVVMVDSDSYEGIESVPDPGIHDLIRASVQEWEKRALQNQKLN